MRRSRKRQWLPGALLVLVFAWACGEGSEDLTAPASGDVAPLTETGVESPPPLFSVTATLSRGLVEICDNGIDDNEDGVFDEAQCYYSGVDGEPVSTTDGIVPEVWNDNPNCSDLGYGFGFKIDESPDGTFTFTAADGELTGGAPSDPNNSVTISNAGNGSATFDWTSTLPVDAVFVKGGPVGGNLYVYDPNEDTGDTGLGTPAVDGQGNGVTAPAISHIEFCYDYEVDVSKDASTSLTRTYEWDITKDLDASYVGFPGDAIPDPDHEYTITVDRTGFTDSDWAVSGTITIDNNTPFTATIESVTDEISGVGATDVVCDEQLPYDLLAGETLSCSYESSLTDGTDRTNTATVETSGDVGGGEATADVLFDGSTTINDVNPTVNVTDDFATPDGDDDLSFGPLGHGESATYTREFACPTDESLYNENGVYTNEFVNTATIDEDQTKSDDATVDITCYLPAEAKVIKTTDEGGEDIGQFPFSFELYAPALNPDVDDPSETQTLNAAGEVVFTTELEDEGTWTVVEVLPDGWVSTTDLTCTFEVAFPGSANQTFDCTFDNVEKSRVDLLKLTDGQPTMSQTWSFALYEGPDGFGGTLLASDATPPALLDFESIDLDPSGTYTVCEEGVPAGWSTEWKIDTDGDGVPDMIVPPYNPNADDPIPNDVGNDCFDFGAGTAYPLPIGATLAFQVDNTFPGGDPRTPGYWKNWNGCTNGNQVQTATKNGGPAAGWYILDYILSSPGITLGGLEISTCDQGVSILDQRDLESGRKRASDAAYTLAMHLLAAQLNFAAGAEQCPEATQAVADGQALLAAIGFDGMGRYLRPNDPLYQQALALAETLDQYNNGELCP